MPWLTQVPMLHWLWLELGSMKTLILEKFASNVSLLDIVDRYWITCWHCKVCFCNIIKKAFIFILKENSIFPLKLSDYWDDIFLLIVVHPTMFLVQVWVLRLSTKGGQDTYCLHLLYFIDRSLLSVLRRNNNVIQS